MTISRSALTIVVASLASFAACGDAFVVPAGRSCSFGVAPAVSSASCLRAEAEEASEGEAAAEASAEGEQSEGGEEEQPKDCSPSAEAKIKSRRNDLASIIDSVET